MKTGEGSKRGISITKRKAANLLLQKIITLQFLKKIFHE
ncbi:hypothetical protein HMPREF9954_1024 [Streptococcus infantis SK970]|nr:hypothetical protein HMPREF9954_1024 [Streptococcus infantis SK970]